MNYTKLILTGEFAHFKIPYSSKHQRTYAIPPISTVIGMLKNIFGENISDFNFGFIFKSGTAFTDVQTTYKQSSPNKKMSTDICYVEYLTDPVLIIYTSLSCTPGTLLLSAPLNFGKTNCLAYLKITSEELKVSNGSGINQWTPTNIGSGRIFRIAVETNYNRQKGFYDIRTDLFRLNTRFDSMSCNSSNGIIQMWHYKGGKICAKTY